MVLCQNRVEGFGPRSSITANLPTSCFTDVIVVPLATWIYLLLAVVALASCIRLRKRNRLGEKHVLPSDELRSHRGICGRILSILYYLLIVAMLAMMSLVIARKVVAQLGIGLLPFTYAGILIAAGLHVSASGSGHASLARGKVDRKTWKRIVKLVNGIYWLILACVMAVWVAVSAEEASKLGRRTGQQAQYPLSDEITDVAVMVGVEIALFILELIVA